jgi:2,4-dienoyl-CoA reductase (NADPH2)
MAELHSLFQSIDIGKLQLKNSIVFLAAATEFSDNGFVDRREIGYMAARAGGGAGLLTTGMLIPSPMGSIPLNVIYDDKFIPNLHQLTGAAHKDGAKIAAQVGIQYFWARDEGAPIEEVSPSGIATRRNSSPRALTTDEVHRIIDAYGEAVRRARDAGFDAVEIMCGIGYLIARFLSPLTNRRTDEYGGSLDNRMRFMLEIIASSKGKVGDDYPLICRICADDFMEGGQRLDESRQVAVALEQAGVHCLNVGAGWHECRTPLVYMSVPRGNFVYLAEEIKKVVKIPVIAGYRINDPILADEIVAGGKADLVGMARALIADPDLPYKAREGRFDDIRPCIACGYCLDSVLLAAPMACAVNPEAGRETELSIAPAKQVRKVHVIGGGPAGMEAATVAAQRGHDVTLFEKSAKLGGNLLMAAVPSYKWEVKTLIKYMDTQLQKSGAKVILETEADEATIARGNPDAVIVATGAQPAVPDIPGVDRGNVATALEVLAGEKEVGDRVVVVGGGQVGCETAEHLAERGMQVTILEMLPRLGSDIGLTTRWVIMQRLQQAGIATEAGARVIEIGDNGVKAERDGSIESFEADSVVLAAGLTPENELAQRLKGKIAEVHCIGDCAEVQKIANAIEAGFRIAIEI